uniref:Putative secreted peptide n=1 Tax=Anopheles braziliensis TaxID=58242 RepID=A0A2M3ZVT2_9DIPT
MVRMSIRAQPNVFLSVLSRACRAFTLTLCLMSRAVSSSCDRVGRAGLLSLPASTGASRASGTSANLSLLGSICFRSSSVFGLPLFFMVKIQPVRAMMLHIMW